MKKQHLKLAFETVPEVGEVIVLKHGDSELLMQPEGALKLVDAILEMLDIVEARRLQKKPVLRVVGGKNAVH